MREGTVKRAFVAAAVVTAFAVTGCAASHTATHTAQQVHAAATRKAAPPASSAVQPVPGSNQNEYRYGPFTVTMSTGQPTALPDHSGYQLTIDIKNTSASFIGWTQVTVEFVKGHSLKGQLLGTASSYDQSGDTPPPIAPGQSEVQEVTVPSNITSADGFVTWQMTDALYGTGTMDSDPSSNVPVNFAFSTGQ